MKLTINILIVFLFSFLKGYSQYSSCTTQMNNTTKLCTPWEYYKPLASSSYQLPLIRVRISIHVIQKGNGDSGFQVADTVYIQGLIKGMNYMVSHLPKTFPQDSFNPSSYFADARIQYVLNGIYFHRIQSLWNVPNTNLYGERLYDSCVRDNMSLDTFHKDSTIHVFMNMGGQWVGISSGEKRWAFTPGIWGDYLYLQSHPGDSINFWTGAQLVVHEIGHCFGLNHMFYVPNQPQGSGEDCIDVPLQHKGFSNNIMDYNLRNTWAFSALQVGKIRFGLMGNFGNASDCVIKDWCGYNSSNTITIPNGTVAQWKSPRKLSGDVIVANGGHLSIQSDLSMPPNGIIYVEPGGILDIENCKINNACGYRWGGIMVKANTHSGSSLYGTAILTNATIENAEYGIRTGTPSNDMNGGVVQTYRARFHNCKIGIWFQKDSGHVSGYGSEIDSTVFITDGNVPGYSHCTEVFAKLDSATHIRFYGDSFINALGNLNVSRSIGILAQNSTFTVCRESYDSSAGGCIYPIGTNSVFKNLSKGIVFSGNGTVKILDTKFINVQRAIRGSTNAGALIYKNNFYTDANIFTYTGLHDTIIHLEMDTSHAFDIRNNYFNFKGPNSLSTSYQHIVIRKSNIDDTSYVRGDSIFATNHTNGAFGFGILTDNDNNRLKINCNNFNWMKYDIYNTSGQLAQQGTISKEAGNRFSNAATYNIDNLVSNTITYYYNSKPRSNPSIISLHVIKTSISSTDTTCPAKICWTATPTRPFEITPKTDPGEGGINGSYKLYPNPTKGLTTFEYQLPDNEVGAYLQVYDINGRLMHQNLLSSGNGQLQIDASNWRAGIYLYRVVSNTKTLNIGKLVNNNK